MSKRKQPDQTRQQILAAAVNQFHRRGFNGAGLEDILAGTGLTRGALYHHFRGKQDLGYAIVDEIFPDLVRRMWLDPLDKADDPITVLIGLIAGAGRMLGSDDIEFGCPINNLALEMSAADEGFRTRINRVYDLWRDGLARAFKHGQDRGTLREDLDAEAAALFVVGALSGCRGLAKNANSPEILVSCGRVLIEWLETLRPEPGPTFTVYRKQGC